MTATSYTKTVSVTKADGSPCYSFKTTLAGMGEVYLYSWKDAAGQVVATGRNGFGIGGGLDIMCADGSETEDVRGGAQRQLHGRVLRPHKPR